MADETNLEQTERYPARLRTDLTIILVSWGVFGSCWINAVQGAPYTAYAVRLGATPLMLGLLSAAIMLGMLGQLPSSYLIEHIGRRKTIFLIVGLTQRLSWVLIGALPFLLPAHYGAWRVAALGGLVLLSATLGSMGTPAWVSWMAHIIPERVRARFLGVRYRLATITGILTALAVGKILDWNSSDHVFFAIFAIAGVLGVIDIALFFFVPSPPEIRSEHPLSPLALLAIPWRDARFRRYLAYAASSTACYTLAGQFFMLYLMNGIGLGKFYANLYLVVIPLTFSAFLGPVVGRHISDFGNRPLVLVATLCAIPLPVMWGLAGHDSHVLMTSAGLLGGVTTGVLGVAEFNLWFTMTPEAKRPAYLAAIAVVAGLTGAVAPIVGGLIARSLQDWHTTIAGFQIINLHAVFLGSTVLRIIHALVFVPRLPEAEARPARDLVAEVLRGPVDAAGSAVRKLKRR